MTTMTIYHNQSCSKSLKVLELLTAAGYQPTIINYLEQVPTADELRGLHLPAKDLLRWQEPLATELELSDQLTDEEIYQILTNHPSLIQRPIVVYKHQALICRPPERVWELLNNN